MTKGNRKTLIARCLLMSTSALVAAGFVGTAAAQSVLMEEVIVTAQKREQNVQDVGIAITAISGSQLRALGYTNAQEVTALAPGVSTMQPNGEANYAIGIRGVANNDFTTNVESPVAIYVDEVYISQMSGAGFLLFDIERVEVLRGPQGTLFGRNATGGLVQYVTVKPSDEFNGYGSATYGRFDRLKLQGALTVPIMDKVSARASFATHQGGGYIENRLNPQEKLNNANESAGRLQVLVEPNEDLEILLNARFGQQDIRTGFFEYLSAVNPDGVPTPGVPNPDLGGYVDNDGDVYAGDWDTPGRNDLNTAGYTGTVKWNFDWGQLTSLTDFQTVKRDYIEDSDASPVDYFQFYLTTDTEQFSQELRLNGESDALKWVAGFYYMDLKVRDSNGGITRGLFEALANVGAFGPELEGLTADELPFNGIRNPYATDTETWSLFGQLEYSLTDRLTVIGGFRWIEEDKSHRYDNNLMWYPATSRSGQDPNADVFAPALDGLPYLHERSDSNWSALAQINFVPVDNLLLYASWNRGVKSGGYNAPLLPSDFAITNAFMTYDPEKLDAFEVGFKWDSTNGRFRLNGAAYYYDYKNYQAFSIIGLDTSTLNAQAESKGFELEMQANPIDGLDMQFGVAYIDADVEDVPGLTVGADTDGDGVADVLPLLPGATVTPVQTPKWNLTGLIRYEMPIGGDNGSIAFQADGQYRSKHHFALTNLPASTESGYFLANASITWFAPGENWSLRGFVQNVTNKKYVVQTFDLSGSVSNGGLFGLVEQYYGRPRTWGVTLNYSF